MKLLTNGWTGNDVTIPLNISIWTVLRNPSWLGLALYCLAKAGWPLMELLSRVNDPDYPIDIVILYRSDVIRDTYTEWTEDEETA